MSRIGMKPVEIIAGVTVAVAGDKVTVEGKLGKLELTLPAGINAAVEGNEVKVTRVSDEGINKAKTQQTRANGSIDLTRYAIPMVRRGDRTR